ncbi:hypothetical protein [Nocardia sp. NBC_01388]|uniref:hypothetical protein n=1 Tax=Nocardia sp. NBC_01388 TaxID=2903596 RepID=UPI0032496CF6
MRELWFLTEMNAAPAETFSYLNARRALPRWCLGLASPLEVVDIREPESVRLLTPGGAVGVSWTLAPGGPACTLAECRIAYRRPASAVAGLAERLARPLIDRLIAAAVLGLRREVGTVP